MTVTETAAAAVQNAVEGRVASHLHPVGSFDVADHPVPTGREEIWRFTPMKRLRNLHGDADLVPGGARATLAARSAVFDGRADAARCARWLDA